MFGALVTSSDISVGSDMMAKKRNCVGSDIREGIILEVVPTKVFPADLCQIL